MMQHTRLRQAVSVVTCAVVLLVNAGTRPEPAHGAPSDATVTVQAGTTLGTVPDTTFGMNTAAWDAHLRDSAVPGLLQGAGVTMLRFPGGSTADNYHWQDNTMTPGGGYVNPNDTFDAFMRVAQQSSAQPLITVNYGSNRDGTAGGDPNEAAAWVRYANLQKGYGVRYWEIGNEVYGNGTYPNGWETDLHGTKGPAAYAANALTFIDAMKRVDPSIQVGVALTTPGYWPDGQSPDWNSTVLAAACSKIDFVDVHWYPQGTPSGTDAGLLASSSEIPGIMVTLRDQINRSCGASAAHIQIFNGELNTGNTGKQLVNLPNALFLADSMMTWLENGAAHTGWWDLHNGKDMSGNLSNALYGDLAYGDLGILASGDAGLPANTPYPPYFGLQMLAHLVRPGDQMVATTAAPGPVAVHAVRRPDGTLALLLINKDPAADHIVPVALQGYVPQPTATTYTYGMNSTSIASGSLSHLGATFMAALPRYSLTVLVLSPAVAPAPAVPATATSTSEPLAVTIAAAAASPSPQGEGSAVDLSATIVTTAPLYGAVVDFEVYRASGAKVYQTWQAPVSISAHTPRTFTVNWAPPADVVGGGYTLKIGVFSSGWSSLLAWRDGAASFNLGPVAAPPAATSTSTPVPPAATNTATPTPPTATETSTPSPSATSTATSTPAPPTVTDTSTPSPSATSTTTPSPSATSTTTPSPSATSTATSTPAMPTATGTTGSATQPSVTITAPSAVAAVSPGEAQTFSAAIAANTHVADAIVDFQVYNGAGALIAQTWQSAVDLSPGEPRVASASWAVPRGVALGSYTLKVGVFNRAWTSLYAWDNGSATFTVVPLG